MNGRLGLGELFGGAADGVFLGKLDSFVNNGLRGPLVCD